jgi:hypothetical protein
MRSSVPLGNIYLSAGPQIGMSSIYGTVMLGISGCRIKVTSSWNIGTEFVQPIGKVTRHSVPKGDWNVGRSHNSGARPQSS